VEHVYDPYTCLPNLWPYYFSANSGVMSPTIPTNPRPAFRDEVARDSEMMSPTVSTISRGARAVIGRV
jgi:hypothetical protein